MTEKFNLKDARAKVTGDLTRLFSGVQEEPWLLRGGALRAAATTAAVVVGIGLLTNEEVFDIVEGASGSKAEAGPARE